MLSIKKAQVTLFTRPAHLGREIALYSKRATPNLRRGIIYIQYTALHAVYVCNLHT